MNLSNNDPLDVLNKLCQQLCISVLWDFQKQGLPHESEYCATITFNDMIATGAWTKTKTEAKRSAAKCILQKLEQSDVSLHCFTVPKYHSESLVLADIDNSLDIARNYGFCDNRIINDGKLHAFCGRSFQTTYISDAVTLHRALTCVKNAAEMVMSFHAIRIINIAVKDGIKTVVVISKDAALGELVAQIEQEFPFMNVEHVTSM